MLGLRGVATSTGRHQASNKFKTYCLKLRLVRNPKSNLLATLENTSLRIV